MQKIMEEHQPTHLTLWIINRIIYTTDIPQQELDVRFTYILI